jgi:hypothetical protein
MFDFREPHEVPVPQWNSDEPFPPLAMLAATSPRSRERLEDAKRMGCAKPSGKRKPDPVERLSFP